MSSSRIFVKGLPPNITENDFRKHFSAKGREITDVRLLPERRIGYVGYKTPEAASGAVKYFHRTYIRMSRVEVELAKSISDPSLRGSKKSRDAIADSRRAPASRQGDAAPGVPENTKKRKREVEASDPKLREYLTVMQGGRLSDMGAAASEGLGTCEAVVLPEEESDDEYEAVPSKKQKKAEENGASAAESSAGGLPAQATDTQQRNRDEEMPPPPPPPPPPSLFHVSPTAPDDEWLRSRTSRTMDLVGDDDDDDDDEDPPEPPRPRPDPPREPARGNGDGGPTSEPVQADPEPDADEAPDRTDASRIFVRNLSYTVTEDELRKYFEQCGNIEETHLAVDKNGTPKGFAFVLFSNPPGAEKALRELDGSTFQGRLIHIIPAEARRSRELDEFALSKLPLKKQNLIRKKAQAASSSFNWNSLFMSQDAVNASVAHRLGVSKSEMLDPTSSDDAVKQALAETNIIQETKAYFAANGIDPDAFRSRGKRGDDTILVKNFPYGTSTDAIRTLFEAHGSVLRVLMPPSGTIAIVRFAKAAHGKAAFAKLAYTRLGESILFLEKAPAGLFGEDGAARVEEAAVKSGRPAALPKASAGDLLERNDAEGDGAETSSLFIKNLAFSTTTDGLGRAFGSLAGFVSARVKTKTDAKKPGQVLSMGFGFVEFRTKADAAAGLEAMDGFVLDGHALSVRPSHKGHDAAEERRREDRARKIAGKKTKIIIKNLPFEATKKDVRTLFATYGQLRSVRVPRKFDRSRGFAFAEFITPKEAENALDALGDTHLLGRRLVLDFAEADAVDPEEEIEKMQRKIGGQVHKVTLQQLTGRGRTKVDLGTGTDTGTGGDDGGED